MPENKINYLYCKVIESRRDYLGERYFRYSYESDTVTQIVISSGEQRKGRPNTFGIHLISRITLFSNYMAMNYTVPCTKADFSRTFEKVVKILR